MAEPRDPPDAATALDTSFPTQDAIDADVFDLDDALSRVHGDWDTLNQVIAVYHEDADTQMRQLRASIDANDPEGVERTAHRFKGTLLVLRAHRATKIAEQVEQLGRSGNLDGVKAAFDALAGELHALDEAIEVRFASAQAAPVSSPREASPHPERSEDRAPLVLVAEDDRATRLLVAGHLRRWGYDVETCSDGAEALRRIESTTSPVLALLDWLMPELDGIEVCRAARSRVGENRPYIIMLTSRDRGEDLVSALDAGADDYIVKPYDPPELRARIGVGVRMLQLQTGLAERVAELEDALRRVRQLEEFLPMCSYCKKIRDEEGGWQPIEAYLSERTDSRVSHGICPQCDANIVQPMLLDFKRKLNGG